MIGESGTGAHDTTDQVRDALARFDRTFASGDPDALARLFAVDAQLLLLYGEPIEGRDAIREHWARLFTEYDPGNWRADHGLVDVHGDRAYALSTYTETLVKRQGDARLSVRGRLAMFLRRDADGTWLVAILMNSHSRPVEKLGRDTS